MAEQESDPSLAALAVLRDERSSVAERHDAFEKMLDLRRGWWGNHSLPVFAHACALAAARRVQGQYGLRADALDWEAAADEALIAFATQAQSIRESPRAWLIAVIRNKLLHAVRDSWPELTATQVEDLRPEEHPAVTDEAAKIDDERVDTAEQARLRQYDALLQAIQTLPPSLRVVAQMIFFDGYTISETAKALGIEDATARKRVQRLREQLRSKLAQLEKGGSR
jgi:RNA polymerase sigma factor (sigma-70 family)